MFENRKSSTGIGIYRLKLTTLILILSLGITLIYYSINSCSILSANISKFQNQIGENRKYRISDNYFNKDEKIFFNSKDNVLRLKKMYNHLIKDARFNFIVSVIQPVDVKNFAGSNKFKNLYEQGIPEEDIFINGEKYSNVKSFQYNDHLVTSSNLRLMRGRYPIAEEYTYHKNAPVPILLGSEYEGIYHLGDMLEVDYIGLPVKGSVIGFLKKNQYIIEQDEIVYLDRYLLLPSLNFDTLPQNIYEKKYQLRIYMQKVNGTIETSQLKANEIQKIVNQFAKNSNLIQFSVIGANNVNLNILNMQANELFVFSSLIGSLIIIYIVLLVSNLILHEVKKNSRNYSIELLCGMSFMSLKTKIALRIFLFALISLLISIITIYVLNGYCNKIGMLLIISIILSVITMIRPLKYIGAINIAQEIRRRI